MFLILPKLLQAILMDMMMSPWLFIIPPEATEDTKVSEKD